MTKPIEVKVINRNLYKIRSSEAVKRELERRGRQIVRAANRTLQENRFSRRVRDRRLSAVGYEMSTFQGAKKPQGRWFVQIYASSNHAKYSNAKHNTLIKVLNDTQNPTPKAVDLAPGKHP
jgi:hypothetical protein